MPCCQVALDEDYHRQGKGSTCEVELSILAVKHEPDELHGKADPEKEVELDKAEEDLVVGEQGLDATVGAEELVNLPAELGVDLPP